jgi:hypothetical protein
MPFYAAKALPFCRSKRTKRNALINFHIIANHSSFADYDSSSVVDEKSFAQRRPRIYVDSSFVNARVLS